jgi:hypothetical protein
LRWTQATKLGEQPGTHQLQCPHEGGRDLVLHLEDIAKWPVVSLRPPVRTRLSIDKLSGDAYAVTEFADTSFEDIGGT